MIERLLLQNRVIIRGGLRAKTLLNRLLVVGVTGFIHLTEYLALTGRNEVYVVVNFSDSLRALECPFLLVIGFNDVLVNKFPGLEWIYVVDIKVPVSRVFLMLGE